MAITIELPDDLSRESITRWGEDLIRTVVMAVKELQTTSGEGGVDPSQLLPPGGTAGQVVKKTASGSEWAADTDTNTTYSALTAAQAQTGTATAASTISAKVMADEIDRRVAATIAAIPPA